MTTKLEGEGERGVKALVVGPLFFFAARKYVRR